MSLSTLFEHTLRTVPEIKAVRIAWVFAEGGYLTSYTDIEWLCFRRFPESLDPPHQSSRFSASGRFRAVAW